MADQTINISASSTHLEALLLLNALYQLRAIYLLRDKKEPPEDELFKEVMADLKLFTKAISETKKEWSAGDHAQGA